MTNEYDIGDLVKVIGTFTKTSDDSVIDPTVIRAYYKNPSGITTSLVFGVDGALEKEGIGIYFVEISITESGNWYYRFSGTGNAQGGEETHFKVVRSNIV